MYSHIRGQQHIDSQKVLVILIHDYLLTKCMATLNSHEFKSQCPSKPYSTARFRIPIFTLSKNLNHTIDWEKKF